MYCGNNLLRADKNTRYGCVKKGIYLGMKDVSREVYISKQPDLPKIYCGNKTELPTDYERFGKLSECLQKGYGVGKNIAFYKCIERIIADIDFIISINEN